MVTCVVCGMSYDVSARTDREIRAGRVVARCTLHRKRRRRETVRAEHRRFWLDRFTIEEIVEMDRALMLFFRPSERTALVASATGPTGPTGATGQA